MKGPANRPLVSDKRVHDLDKAGAGDVGDVDGAVLLGPCPSCGADLHVARAKNPSTGRVELALMHAVPFCAYYAKTDPAEIERAVTKKQKES